MILRVHSFAALSVIIHERLVVKTLLPLNNNISKNLGILSTELLKNSKVIRSRKTKLENTIAASRTWTFMMKHDTHRVEPNFSMSKETLSLLLDSEALSISVSKSKHIPAFHRIVSPLKTTTISPSSITNYFLQALLSTSTQDSSSCISEALTRSEPITRWVQLSSILTLRRLVVTKDPVAH